MGFLDNMDDPKNQMLLALGLGLLQGSGRTNKNFGADLGAAGTQGLLAYTGAKQQQSRLAEQDQMRQMREMQMEQMRAQNQRQQGLQGLAQRAYAPGMPPPIQNDDEGNRMPMVGAGGGDKEYVQGLAQFDPQAAMAMRAQMAAMNQRNLQKLGPGDSLYDVTANKMVASAPDKPPTGMMRGPDGQLSYDPAYMKGQIDIAQAKRPQITVDNRQENAFASKVGAEFGEAYVGLQRGDAMASNKINKLSRLESLLDSSGKTGKFTPNTMELKAAADSLGFKVDPRLPYQQAAQALSNEIALEMRNPSGGAGMPGALSDSDRVFLTNMVPNLAKTPEGNKELLATAKKLAQRDKEVAALAREYKKKNGRFDEGFYEVLSRYSARTPLFPEQKDPYAGFSSTVVR